MKVGMAILIFAAGLGACSKGVGTLVTTNQSNTNAGTAISPGSQAGAIGSSTTGASTIALTTDPQAALFLAQLITQLSNTSLLNTISNDIDTEALSLADTTADADVEQAQKSEISAFINYFFSNPDMVISGKTCSHITDHMDVRISRAQNWLSYMDGRLGCIDKAAPSIGACWGAASATDATRPYGAWKQVQSILTAVVAQVQNNETTVKDLCKTYFAQNPAATINKVDFLAAITAIVVSAGTTIAAGATVDPTQADSSATLSSLVSHADLAQNTQVLVQQAWTLHSQLISDLKYTARICTSKLPLEERKPFEACWMAVSPTLPVTTSTESVTP